MSKIWQEHINLLKLDCANKDAEVRRQRALLNGLHHEIKRKQSKIEELEHELAVTKKMLELDRKKRETKSNIAKLTDSHSLLEKALDENERLHESIRRLRKAYDVSATIGNQKAPEDNFERVPRLVAGQVGRGSAMASRD